MIKMHVELGDLVRVSLGPEVPHDSLKKRKPALLPNNRYPKLPVN